MYECFVVEIPCPYSLSLFLVLDDDKESSQEQHLLVHLQMLLGLLGMTDAFLTALYKREYQSKAD
jgi:hypothetical protein